MGGEILLIGLLLGFFEQVLEELFTFLPNYTAMLS